jgi:hypothetical protein
MKSPSRYLYTKETAQCPPGESRTMLTLLLHSLKWDDISAKKQEKAIKKLSRFFLVPKVSFLPPFDKPLRMLLWLSRRLKSRVRNH